MTLRKTFWILTGIAVAITTVIGAHSFPGTSSSQATLSLGSRNSQPIASTAVQGGISFGSIYENQLENESESARASVMQAVYNAGVRWVRVDIPDSTRNDAIVQSARAAGLNVDLIVQDWKFYPPTPDAIGLLAHQLAAQYGPQGIHTYEILNEPNASGYLTASAYTAILKSAYTNIHAVDSAATVISAGLEPAPGDREPYNYLSGMYSAGVHGYLDGVGDHPYSYPDTPDTNDPLYNAWQYMPMGWPTSSCANVGPSDCLYSIMSSHGDGDKRIWLTEFGAPTGTDNNYRAYSQRFQAASITQAFVNANSAGYSGPVFNYQWQDDSEGDFGLIDSNGVAKSSLAAFTNAVNRNVPAPPTLSAGQSLQVNQSITNVLSGWVLQMQNDGNLVLSNALDNAIWASGTYGHPGAYALMQGDGNFVIYDVNQAPLWASNTYGNSGAFLVLQDDNNLVVDAAGGGILWSTGT